MCGSFFFVRIITILFSGVCTLFLTISAIVPSRGTTFFSQASGCGEQEVGVASGSGWNLWVWLLAGCGFKEIYRFPHTTYPYSFCICTFLQQHPNFFVHFVNGFTFLFQYFF